MKGLIVISNNFSYEGDIVHNEPHGHGTFHYSNGHKYCGSCIFGKLDGFGKYMYSPTISYEGYFSYGEFNGIGTYESDTMIIKGNWRRDKRHGHFIKTSKTSHTTTRQTWIRDKLIHEEPIEYITAEALKTIKENPKRKKKQHQAIFKGIEKKCIACSDQNANATNTACGHICMCYECLNKCDMCPICRAPLESVSKLYVS